MRKDRNCQIFFGIFFASLLLVAPLVFVSVAQAAINQSFTYQGKLTNKSTGAVITNSDASCMVDSDGSDICDFRARIYTALTGGTLVWQEVETNVDIDNDDGSFELTLDCSGTFSDCNQNSGPDFNTSSLYIEVAFAPAGDEEFTETFSPRKQLGAVPYSFNADTVDGVNVATVTATPEGTVTGSVGDVALDTNRGSLYIKTSGTNTNTGWSEISGTGGSSTLSGLTDATISSPASGQILIYDGTDSWDNKALSGDATIATDGTLTIGSNTVNLSADTTGNYVATLTDVSNSLLMVANSGTENAAVTLDVADDSFDFAQLADSLSLDAATTVALGGNGLVINLDSTGDFDIQDNGTSALFVKDDGKVGVGTANPGDKIHVYDDTDEARVLLELESNNVDDSLPHPGILFEENGSAARNIGAGIFFDRDSFGAGKLQFALQNEQTWNAIEVDPATDTAMTLTYQKRVGIGNASPEHLLTMESSGGGYYSDVDSQWYNGSSMRWKENIREIDSPLDKIAELRGVYYNWDEEHGGAADIGFIAEEVGKVIPELVGWDEDDPGYANGMSYGNMTALLLAGIKEQQAQLELLFEAWEPGDQEAAVNVAADEMDWGSDKLRTFLEGVVFKAKATFASAVEFLAEVTFGGRVIFGDKDMAGFAVIEPGSRQVKVEFEQEFTSRPVVNVSLEGKPAVDFYLTEVGVLGFKIELKVAASERVNFNWTALAVRDASTFRGREVEEEEVKEENEAVDILEPQEEPQEEPGHEVLEAASSVDLSAEPDLAGQGPAGDQATDKPDDTVSDSEVGKEVSEVYPPSRGSDGPSLEASQAGESLEEISVKDEENE